jgi:hypothetical protein
MRRLSLLLALLTAGCTSYSDGPTPAELNAIRQAQNVFPSSYKADVSAFMRNYLNDPTGIRSAAISQPQLKELPTGSRYISCLRYDAKKSDGQYAGTKTALIIFISGKLDRLIDAPVSREMGEGMEVRETCKDAVYAPFPELQGLKR